MPHTAWIHAHMEELFWSYLPRTVSMLLTSIAHVPECATAWSLLVVLCPGPAQQILRTPTIQWEFDTQFVAVMCATSAAFLVTDSICAFTV